MKMRAAYKIINFKGLFMGECEFTEGCLFYKGGMEADESRTAELKEKYCMSNSLHCSRFLVASAVGEDSVPGDLFPDEKEKAYIVIAENS